MQYRRILEAFEQRWVDRYEQNKKLRTKKLILESPDIKDLISFKEVFRLLIIRTYNQTKFNCYYIIKLIQYQLNLQLQLLVLNQQNFLLNSINSIPQSKLQQTNQAKEAEKKIRLKQQLQEECPICMMNLDELQNVCEIDGCQHQICLTCIKEWGEKYKTQCPYCRAKFKKIYPLENGKRKKTPIKLNLKQPKWQPEEDQFYNSQEEQDQKCQLCGCSHSQYLMLVCDKCNEQMCHTFCDPGFLEFFIPEKNWYCLDCRKSKLIYHKPK